MSSLEYFRAHCSDFLLELRDLVEIETPSGHGPGIQAAADFLCRRFAPLGELSRVELSGWGPLVRLTRRGHGSRVLLLAHYDTVWPVGSWPEPWRVTDERIIAPGACDMKGGLLFVLCLLRELDQRQLAHPELEILLNPDEEVGSPASRPFIEEAARRADFVLVTECPGPGGELKIERKGSAEIVLDITGRSSHQGEDPDSGINAVVEAARQLLAFLELANPGRGTTVGPNVIRGGTMSNVVADCCRLAVDVRAWTRAEVERINTALAAIRPVHPGARVRVSGGWNRPPMQATAVSRQLFERSRAIGKRLGLELGGIRWGGSSDGNLSAAAGAATLDGLGPEGAGSHDRSEHIVISSLPQRYALLSELVQSLAREPEQWLDPAALRRLEQHRQSANRGGSACTQVQ